MAKGSGNTRSNSPSSNPQLKGAGNTDKQMAHGNNLNYSDAVDNIMSVTGLSENEANDIFWAINEWSGSMSDEIREASRGENKNSSVVRNMELLEKFIELSPKWNGGTTYRGLELSDAVIDSFDKSMIGKTFDPLGIASWSSDYSIAEGFAGLSNKFILRCKKPQNGTSIKFASVCPSEDEVTTSGRCQYKITNVTKTSNGYDKVTIVDVEPVANKPKKK